MNQIFEDLRCAAQHLPGDRDAGTGGTAFGCLFDLARDWRGETFASRPRDEPRTRSILVGQCMTGDQTAVPRRCWVTCRTWGA